MFTMLRKILRLIPDSTNIDFMRLRYMGFAISVALVVASLGLLFTKGINWGIDFTGGLVIEAKITPAPDIAGLRADIDALDLGSVSIQEFGSADTVLIRLPQQKDGGPEARKAAENAVRGKLAEDTARTVEYRRVEYVGPAVGDELRKAGFLAVALSVVAIMLYVWLRFEWQFGVATTLTLVHDAILMLGFFALTGIEFDLPAVAAVLAITGYSVNDTVVIFDFVRDSLRKYRKMPLIDVLNLSINRTLSRTQLTGLTTLLALTALLVFGGDVVRALTWALVVGVLAGTYSSVFISAPVMLYLNPRKGQARALDE